MWNFYLLKNFNEFVLYYEKCKGETTTTYTDMKSDLI